MIGSGAGSFGRTSCSCLVECGTPSTSMIFGWAASTASSAMLLTSVASIIGYLPPQRVNVRVARLEGVELTRIDVRCDQPAVLRLAEIGRVVDRLHRCDRRLDVDAILETLAIRLRLDRDLEHDLPRGLRVGVRITDVPEHRLERTLEQLAGRALGQRFQGEYRCLCGHCLPPSLSGN